MTILDDSAGVLGTLDPYVRWIGRTLVDTVPSLKEPLAKCRGYYAHSYVRYAQWRYNRRHDAPIDPYRIAWVDPDRITHAVEPTGLPRFRLACAVMDGDWDRDCTVFTEMDVYQAFHHRYAEDGAWTETDFFQRVLSEINEGRTPWGCDSREALEARCHDLDSLFETIEDTGFKTQRELLTEDIDDPIGSQRISPFGKLLNDEIAVDIARDGELLFADGRNRLSIAKILDVDEIPVMILRRHARWIPFRDRVARFGTTHNRLPEPVADHPDLRQLDPTYSS